ncbi:GrpB family protein [Rhodopila sp.]|uniref:GrpB family protein n=1 Tax=Rhodopila sp. TaxID=2480087 RepID=UPI003D1426EC
MLDQSIALTDYDPAWQDRFAEQQARLAHLLRPWLAAKIEHIGSTSVPALRSKPIVDLLAPVRSLAACHAAIPVLEADGWLFWPEDPNHNYRLWFLRPNPTQRTHHLQIIQHDHPDGLALTSFRDSLRRDPEVRGAYARLKQELAQKHQDDRNAYSNAKTAFVQSVLKTTGSGQSSRKPV